jgi:hypothetical protein
MENGQFSSFSIKDYRHCMRRPGPGGGKGPGRAGFIEALVMGPPQSASSATVPPIATAASSPTARYPWRPR